MRSCILAWHLLRVDLTCLCSDAGLSLALTVAYVWIVSMFRWFRVGLHLGDFVWGYSAASHFTCKLPSHWFAGYLVCLMIHTSFAFEDHLCDSILKASLKCLLFKCLLSIPTISSLCFGLGSTRTWLVFHFKGGKSDVSRNRIRDFSL